MGFALGWGKDDLRKQVYKPQGALAWLDERGVLAASWLRAAVFRECARVAKSMAAGHEGSLQAALQKAVDPGAELITAMTNVMSVPSKDLGDNINSLAPPGMSQLSIQNRVEQASPPEAPPPGGEGHHQTDAANSRTAREGAATSRGQGCGQGRSQA